MAGNLGRRVFKRVTIHHADAPTASAFANLGREEVKSAAEEAERAAVETAYLLKPFYSRITGSMIDWRTDADVGIVPERRTIVTPTGRIRGIRIAFVGFG